MNSLIKLSIVLILISHSVSANWVDKHVLPNLTINCERWPIGYEGLYARQAGDYLLSQWLYYDVTVRCLTLSSLFVTYDSSVTYQDACRLLQVDSRESVIIHNAFIELSRDPDFVGQVCSISGLFN